MKKNKYLDWDYDELAAEVIRKDLSAKEARMLHKALKQYNSGIPLVMRYPNLPLWISIAALTLVLLRPVLLGILR